MISDGGHHGCLLIVSHYFPKRNLANNCICLFFQQTENFASEH